jgi:hypothetical protein
MNHPRLAVIIGLLIIATMIRLMPHPPNFTPIAAMALFGGAYLEGRIGALVLPLSVLFATDLVIGLHSTMPFVYAGFAATAAMGFGLRTHRGMAWIAGAAGLSSVLFFLLTNFGVWWAGGLYPKDFGGLVVCYVAAIPFFQNSLVGDLFYAGVLFGGMGVAEHLIPWLRQRPALADNHDLLRPQTRYLGA